MVSAAAFPDALSLGGTAIGGSAVTSLRASSHPEGCHPERIPPEAFCHKHHFARNSEDSHGIFKDDTQTKQVI